MFVRFLITLCAFTSVRAQTTGSIRLTGSTSRSAGRLEIFYNSQWGTICDNSFTSTEATVACRELGYIRASNYGPTSRLGYSTISTSQRIWLDSVACSSSGTAIRNCSSNGIGIHDCTHSEDIVIFCSNSGVTSGGSSVTSSEIIGGVFVLFVLSIFFFIGVMVVRRYKTQHRHRITFQEIFSSVNFQPVTDEMVITTEAAPADQEESSYSTQPQQSPPACLTPSDPKLTNQPPPSYPAATCQLYVPEPHPVPPQFSPYTPLPDYQTCAEACPPVATTAFIEPPENIIY